MLLLYVMMVNKKMLTKQLYSATEVFITVSTTIEVIADSEKHADISISMKYVSKHFVKTLSVRRDILSTANIRNIVNSIWNLRIQTF